MAFNEAAYMPKSDEWQFKMHNSTMEFTVPWFGNIPLNTYLQNYTNTEYNTKKDFTFQIAHAISLGAGAGNEKSTIKLNERLDRSIAYCAMDDDADLSKRYFYGNVKPLVIQECNSREDAQHPVAMFIHSANDYSNSWINANSKSANQSDRPWGERVDNVKKNTQTTLFKKSVDDSNPDYEVKVDYYDVYFGDLSPVTSWDFKKVVFLINVVCSKVNPEEYDYWNDYNNSASKATLSCDLYSYCNSKTEDGKLIKDEYPYIHRISFSPAFGEYEADPENPNTPLKEREPVAHGFGSLDSGFTTGASFQPILLSDCNGFTYETGDPPINNRAVVYGNPTRQSGPTYFYASKWDTETHKDEIDVTSIRFRIGCSLGCTGANDYFMETPSIRTSGSDSTQYGIGIGWNKFHFKPVATSSSNDTQNHILVWLDTKNDFESIEAFREYCRKQAAYLGCFFTDDYRTAIRGTLTQEDMHLGVIDGNGVTHGEYVSGEDITKEKQWNWGDPIEDTPYDPDKKPPGRDPNNYEDDPQSKFNWGNPIAVLGQTHYITDSWSLMRNFKVWTLRDSQWALQKSYEALHNSTESTSVSEDGTLTVSTTTSPNTQEFDRMAQYGAYSTSIDAIVSAIMFPFDLTKTAFTSTVEEFIKIGYSYHTSAFESAKYDEETGNWIYQNPIKAVKAYKVVGEELIPAVPLVFGGSCTYFQEYDSFLDYEPYCSAELYIPYCGSVKIDPKTYMGHAISVYYLVDFNTGACLALVYRDGLVMEQIPGQMGIYIPINAADTTDYINSMYQGQQTIKTAQKQNEASLVAGTISTGVGAVTSAAMFATGNIAGGVVTAAQTLGGIFNTVNAYNLRLDSIQAAEYSLETQELGFKNIQTATPSTSFVNEQECRLVLYRPTFLNGYTKGNFGNYGHTVGFACLENGKLSKFSGLTVCNSIDCSGINATSQEIDLIKNAATTGFYL